jgi:hypothetical protein
MIFAVSTAIGAGQRDCDVDGIFQARAVKAMQASLPLQM